jgi:hypothetical protein
LEEQQSKPAVVERRRDGTIKSGSANPGGKPKWVAEVRNSLRALLPGAVERLARIISDGEDKDANAAIKIALEFSIRKPRQGVNVSGQLTNPLGELSTEDIQALIRAARGGEDK